MLDYGLNYKKKKTYKLKMWDVRSETCSELNNTMC